MELVRGQRLKLADVPLGTRFRVEPGFDLPGPGEIDLVCFGLNAEGRLADDSYVVYFNQTSTPCGGVKLVGRAFELELAALPASIDQLLFAASIDGAGEFAALRSGRVTLAEDGAARATLTLVGADFAAAKSAELIELYRKDGWRLKALGQGFVGDLQALLELYGGSVEEPAVPGVPAPVVAPPVPTPEPVAAPPAPIAPSASRISLEKKLAAHPKLVSLVKKVEISLAKANLSDHRARVALCLDDSGSMANLYATGKVQALAERVLALGCRFDDDGEIDVFLFGSRVARAEPMTLDNYKGFVDVARRRHSVGGSTNYGDVMRLIRETYFPGNHDPNKPYADALPVYVMFVTDGAPDHRAIAEFQLRGSSYEPIFWQFMGIGSTRQDIQDSGQKGLLATLQSAFATDFGFLESLDHLGGRYLDNANFFNVADPHAVSDETLYEKMTVEYPGWVKQARQAGLLPG